MKHIICAALLALLAACGGGDEEEPPPPPKCGADFIGPLQPGQLPPGCK